VDEWKATGLREGPSALPRLGRVDVLNSKSAGSSKGEGRRVRGKGSRELRGTNSTTVGGGDVKKKGREDEFKPPRMVMHKGAHKRRYHGGDSADEHE